MSHVTETSTFTKCPFRKRFDGTNQTVSQRFFRFIWGRKVPNSSPHVSNIEPIDMLKQLNTQPAFVFYGLVAGIVVGLFFGEGCRVVEPFANAFVDLLQMTVLPYLVLTINSEWAFLTTVNFSLMSIKICSISKSSFSTRPVIFSKERTSMHCWLTRNPAALGHSSTSSFRSSFLTRPTFNNPLDTRYRKVRSSFKIRSTPF